VSALTQQEQLFVEAYIRLEENGTKAAIEAGYAAKSAHVQASRLLKRDKVREAIASRKAEIATVVVTPVVEQTNVTFERLLMEAAAIALLDPKDFFGPDGKLLALHEMPERARRAISSCDVDESFEVPEGENVEGAAKLLIQHRTTKIRPHDKLRAIELIAKIQAYFKAPQKPAPAPPADWDAEMIIRWKRPGEGRE